MSTRLFFLAGVAALIAAPVAAQPAKVDAIALPNAGTPKDALRGAWLTYGLTQGETRFSPLEQLTTANVNPK